MRAIAAIVLTLLLGSWAPAPTLYEQIVASGELHVITRNSPTTYFLGVDEEPRGIEYELAKGFADRLGVGLRVSTVDEFWTLLPEVASGSAHIAAAGLNVTKPRRDIVRFGPAYQHVEPLVIYRMGATRPESIADLIGGRIDVIAGTSPVALLRDARRGVPELSWTERPGISTEMLIRRVAAGETDYTIVPSNEFAVLQHYYPETRAAFTFGQKVDVAWALPPKADELREAVSAYFAEITATGKLDEIIQRDQHDAHVFDFVGSRAFVRHLHARFPRYQGFFRLAAAETGLDWRLVAAIAYQESRWDQGAVSPTGVRGVMMLTEHTAEQVGIDDRSDPWESILGGSRYFRLVLDKFPDRIPIDERIWLAAAAYNIGFGHVEDARIITEMQGGDPDVWEDVRKRLPLLADETWYSRVRYGYARGAVPLHYVDNVKRYLALLDWMQGTDIVTDVTATPDI